MLARALLTVAVVGLLANGCNESGDLPDASVEEEPDLSDGTDSTPDGADWVEPDFDPERNLGLLVPEEARACPLGLGHALEDQLRLRARVTFRAGLELLPREEERFEADIIELVELTPGHGEVQAEGAGVFTRTVVGDPQDGALSYEYLQAFRVGAGQVHLSARFLYDLQAGEPLEPVLVLDPQGMLNQLSGDPGWLSVTLPDGSQTDGYLSCDYGSYRTNEYRFTLADGDTLVLSEWMTEVPEWMMFCAAGLARVTYTRGQTTWEVNDFWQLAYMPGNHNIIEFFAFLLDPPDGNVHGIRVNTQSLGIPLDELTWIYTLDSSLTSIEQLTVSEAEYQGLPCFMTD